MPWWGYLAAAIPLGLGLWWTIRSRWKQAENDKARADASEGWIKGDLERKAIEKTVKDEVKKMQDEIDNTPSDRW